MHELCRVATEEDGVNIELALNTLAEASVTEISKSKNPRGFRQSVAVAREGSKIAGVVLRRVKIGIIETE